MATVRSTEKPADPIRVEALHEATWVHQHAIPLGEGGEKVATEVLKTARLFEAYLKGDNVIQIDTDGK